MQAQVKAPTPLTVALLGRDDPARAVLRRALEDLGAQVVCEADPAGVQPDEVLRSGAQVVIVNLASGVEDDIDHLQPVFDSSDVNVVFNEADVSSQLAGWDLARWARHLASKVMGHEHTIPPPPPGAEPLPVRNLMPVPGAPPTPAQLTVERPIEEFMIEAEDRVDAVPSDHLPYTSGVRTVQPEEPEREFSIDVGEVEGALAQIGGTPPEVEQRAVPEPEVPEILVHEGEAAEFDAGLDLAALDAALQLDTRPAPAAPTRSDAELLDEALSGLEIDFDSAPEGGSDGLLELDDDFESTSAPPPAAAPPLSLEDDDLSLSLADDDAASLSLLTLDDDEDEGAAAPAARRQHDDADAGSLSLLNLDDDASGSTAFDGGDGLSLISLDEEDDVAAVPAPRASAAGEALSLDSLEFGGDDPLGGLSLLDDIDATVSSFDDGGATAASASVSTLSLSDDGLGLDDGGSLQLDDDVAALAAQLDALDSAAPRSEVRDLDFIDYSDAPAARSAPAAAATPDPKPVPVATRPAPPAAPAAAPARKSSFGDLDLAPLEDEPTVAPVARAASNYDFSSLNFSLEPTSEELDEAAKAAVIAPPAAPAAPALKTTLDPLLAAMDLAPAKTAKLAQDGPIPRIIVLGASIGGPDALRSFLGGIPDDFPALFVLAQHLENAFFERLAQQLQKASKLPVRVPEQGARARAGEVLVVPANKRVRIERDGVISLADCPTPPKYTPCIDDVMRDAADRFGADATAIIFSGMAGDAIEGAVYLTSLGGEVWAQDPASCVVSSMVDGARARGVVEFVGSPRELAEHCVARYGRA